MSVGLDLDPRSRHDPVKHALLIPDLLVIGALRGPQRYLTCVAAVDYGSGNRKGGARATLSAAISGATATATIRGCALDSIRVATVAG